jgi:hypothetical protein
MTQSGPIPSDERIVDTMIELARAAKTHQMIVSGRGYSRVTTAKTCRVPCGEHDVALVAWREHSIKALATTLDWLVHFLSPAGVWVVWIGPHERMPNYTLRLAGANASGSSTSINA